MCCHFWMGYNTLTSCFIVSLRTFCIVHIHIYFSNWQQDILSHLCCHFDCLRFAYVLTIGLLSTRIMRVYKYFSDSWCKENRMYNFKIASLEFFMNTVNLECLYLCQNKWEHWLWNHCYETKTRIWSLCVSLKFCIRHTNFLNSFTYH